MIFRVFSRPAAAADEHSPTWHYRTFSPNLQRTVFPSSHESPAKHGFGTFDILFSVVCRVPVDGGGAIILVALSSTSPSPSMSRCVGYGELGEQRERRRRERGRVKATRESERGGKVARWQNLIPASPWIAPGWRVWGRNQCSVVEP